VERAGEELYISCSLQPWITEGRVIGQTLGTVSDINDLQCLLDQQKEITASKSHAVALKPRTPKKPKDRRGAFARISILPPKEVENGRDSQPPEPQEAPLAAEGSVTRDPPLPEVAEVNMGPTLYEQSEALDLDHLRVQYLEALYLSKTSLAYLAKGPLARARNLAQLDTDENVRAKLLDFYRESVISTKKLDLKYKDSLNKVIEDAKNAQRTDESNVQPSSLEPGEMPKKKPSRKKKMGKDALYPAEGNYVQCCWTEREIRNSNTLSTESQAQEQKKLVSDLRTRETKMQILLILEVLALETLPAASKETALTSDTATVLAKTPTKRKAESKQKRKDYSSDLDTLIDRLCIWHTVGIDDMFESPEKRDQETKRSSSGKKDQLRDFCADVIIPFYASRLPEQCEMICRKLGGPEVSPKRPKPALAKSASTSRLPPGAAIKQRPRAVPRQTLERVLSDDRSMRHVSPPIFSRSSTAPLVPNLKREASESSQRPASRGTLHKSVSFSNREIDLDADARAQETKRRKLARVVEQKKELDAAISALKKPNRTVAAQGLMNEIESRSRDSQPQKQVVHIAATPRRPKSRPSNHHEAMLPTTLELDVTADDQVIPSSTVRPRGGVSNHLQASVKKRAVLFAIHETPIRPSSVPQGTMPKPVSRLNFFNTSNNVTISSDPTLVESTPATNRVRPNLLTQIENTPMRMSKSMRPVLFTPLKKTEVRVEDAFRDAPVIPADAGKAMDRVMGGGEATEMSVYDALGWNDDYDL
jgi:DNA replication regulator SLD3